MISAQLSATKTQELHNEPLHLDLARCFDWFCRSIAGIWLGNRDRSTRRYRHYWSEGRRLRARSEWRHRGARPKGRRLRARSQWRGGCARPVRWRRRRRSEWRNRVSSTRLWPSCLWPSCLWRSGLCRRRLQAMGRGTLLRCRCRGRGTWHRNRCRNATTPTVTGPVLVLVEPSPQPGVLGLLFPLVATPPPGPLPQGATRGGGVAFSGATPYPDVHGVKPGHDGRRLPPLRLLNPAPLISQQIDHRLHRHVARGERLADTACQHEVQSPVPHLLVAPHMP